MAARTILGIAVQHRNDAARQVLTRYLMQQPGIKVVGAVAHSAELIRLCAFSAVGVVLFEAAVQPAANDRLVTLLLSQAGHPLRVLGIHAALPPGQIVRAYEPGVSALVPYTSLLAISLAAVPTSTLPAGNRISSNIFGLTGRELDVLYLIGAGCPGRYIADELGISPHTVEHHKHRIFAKLDVHNQAHAVAIALRLGVIRTVLRLPSSLEVSPAELPPHPEPSPVVLTRREHEIVSAIGAGYSTKQIARLLGISVRTVDNLQGKLFRKLGVHSRTAALGVVGAQATARPKSLFLNPRP